MVNPTMPIITKEVLVIGAGFGGLGAGRELAKHNIDFDILEKGDTAGGIWRDNTYFGVACDVPGILYCYKYEIMRMAGLPKQPDILKYLEHFATKYKLRPHLKLRSFAYSLTYCDSTGKWTVRTKITTAQATSQTAAEYQEGPVYVARYIIMAVGQLHWPHMPNIPGIQAFTGKWFHSSQWDHTADNQLAGKRVAVIGTGPSATQMIPELAKVAGELVVYQRTPNWVIPLPPLDFINWPAAHIPGMARLLRTGAFFAADALFSPLMWGGRSTKPLANKASRHMQRQVPNPVLRQQLTPNYPLGCKRPIISNSYLPTFSQPNVTLVTNPVAHITPTGIVTADGQATNVDVIIYATGFKASDFFANMDITGQHGRQLHGDIWKDSAEAFLGLAMPGMPGVFALHGPGSFTTSGSNVVIKQFQLTLIIRCILWARQWPQASVGVTPKAMQWYHSDRQRRVTNSVLLSCQSWYRKDGNGDVQNPSMMSGVRFWWLTRRHPKRYFQPVNLGLPSVK